MKFEELKTGHKCIEVKSKEELMQIRIYCVYKKIKLDFEVSDLDIEYGHNLFVIWKSEKACLFWDKISGDRQKFDISDIDEFSENFKNLVGKKKLPQIDLSNRYISIVDDENRDLLFDMLEEQGFVWCNGAEKPREWYQWKTVTRIHTVKKEIYCSGLFCLYENISDILKQYENQKLQERTKQVTKSDFTKADLKDGMIIENRAGKRRLVIGEKLTGKDGFSIIANYKEDLKSKFNEELDIIKVYKIQYVRILTDIFNDENLELIWERKEEQPKRVWTEWKKLYAIGGVMIDDTYDFRYRTNGKKVEVKEVINNNNGRASCSDDDEFDLEYGIKLAAARIGLKVANNTLATLLKAKGR